MQLVVAARTWWCGCRACMHASCSAAHLAPCEGLPLGQAQLVGRLKEQLDAAVAQQLPEQRGQAGLRGHLQRRCVVSVPMHDSMTHA